MKLKETAALLAAAAGMMLSAASAQAEDPPEYDWVRLSFDRICPTRVSLGNQNLGFTCGNNTNETRFNKGEPRDKQIMMIGPWKIKCGDGSWRSFEYQNMWVKTAWRQTFEAGPFDNPCTGGKMRIWMSEVSMVRDSGVQFTYFAMTP